MTPTPEPPEHVCGLTGYNGMIDPPCPACEAAKEAWKKRRSPEPQETRQVAEVIAFWQPQTRRGCSVAAFSH